MRERVLRPSWQVNWLAVFVWLQILASFVLWGALFLLLGVFGAWLGHSIDSINQALGR